jgi:hypothetical protein
VTRTTAADGRPCLAGPLTLGVLLALWTDATGLHHDCPCGGEVLVIGLVDREARGICTSCDALVIRPLSPSRKGLRLQNALQDRLQAAGREPVADPTGPGFRRPWMVLGHDARLDWLPLRSALSEAGQVDLPGEDDPDLLAPWPTEIFTPERACLVRACLRNRDALLAIDRWLPFPQDSTCFLFGAGQRLLPVGALFALWDAHAMGQDCTCGGRMLPVSFGGLLSVGGVAVVCPTCGRGDAIRQGGLGRVRNRARQILAGTAYDITGACFGAAYPGPGLPLWEMLRSLGEADLPPEAWARSFDGVESGISLHSRSFRFSLPLKFPQEPEPFLAE